MYIVPPKLQKKMLIGGLNVAETLIIMGVSILFVVMSALHLLWIPILFLVLSWRYANEHNTLYYFMILIKYYNPAQTFTHGESPEDKR
ncbi:MAG: hypothetical protein FWG21_01325 [Oscillospiraceae bacterium]|nr:hypothetical protein [Oscillospiraceae bacterium]